VSKYASTLPIENAAEVSKLYLFERERLALKHPKQFRFVHRFYRDLFLVPENELDAHGWSRDADSDALDAQAFYDRFTRAAFKHGMAMEALENGARIFTLGDKSTPTLALLSGLHGEERAGPIALLRWLEDTEAGSLIPDATSVWMCPLFATNAWDAFQREPDGVNYNDVWMPGQKGRDESVRDVEASLRAWKPFVFLDLHEDGTSEDGKPYIFGYCTDREFAPALAAALECSVQKWKGSDKNAIGASETFARFVGCKRTATIETAQIRPLRERVDVHVAAVRFAAKELEVR
jgi:predicted deacylase